MRRRPHTRSGSAWHWQRRRPAPRPKKGCALWLLMAGAAAVTTIWQTVEVIL